MKPLSFASNAAGPAIAERCWGQRVEPASAIARRVALASSASARPAAIPLRAIARSGSRNAGTDRCVERVIRKCAGPRCGNSFLDFRGQRMSMLAAHTLTPSRESPCRRLPARVKRHGCCGERAVCRSGQRQRRMARDGSKPGTGTDGHGETVTEFTSGFFTARGIMFSRFLYQRPRFQPVDF